jgi:hypothetical protein
MTYPIDSKLSVKVEPSSPYFLNSFSIFSNKYRKLFSTSYLHTSLILYFSINECGRKDHEFWVCFMSKLLTMRKLLLVIITPSPKLPSIIYSQIMSIPWGDFNYFSREFHFNRNLTLPKLKRLNRGSIVISLSTLTISILSQRPNLSIFIKGYRMLFPWFNWNYVF